MNRKYKIGSKVKILWDKTEYIMTPNCMDIGEVKGHSITTSGKPLVQLCNFHKRDKHYSLHFSVDVIRPLVEVVEDGDAL